MKLYARVEREITRAPRRWVVTGGAGFIGSNLVERLLFLGQEVVVVDDFSTGSWRNLERAQAGSANSSRPSRLSVVEGDVSNLPELARIFSGAAAILHQAALGSVPRSIADPGATHCANVDGTFRVLDAAVEAKVPRVVFASSSSIYGDDPDNPRRGDRTGRPLSPYAASKRCGELYMEAFTASKGLSTISLRYFNVFGPRQDPSGGYAAVIPRWISTVLEGRPCEIYGDGLTSRDFCFVENVVQANVLAAVVPRGEVDGRAFNVGCEDQTSLNELHSTIRRLVQAITGRTAPGARYSDFRPGTCGTRKRWIDRAREGLGYEPAVLIEEGLRRTVQWYASEIAARRTQGSDALAAGASTSSFRSAAAETISTDKPPTAHPKIAP